MTLPPRRFKRRGSGDRLISDLHRKWIRTFECTCWNNSISPCDIDHAIECAHYRSAGNSGAGLKPGDEWLLPLCRVHHREQHTIGQPAFERRYGFSMADKAMEFARLSPDRLIRAAARKSRGGLFHDVSEGGRPAGPRML